MFPNSVLIRAQVLVTESQIAPSSKIPREDRWLHTEYRTTEAVIECYSRVCRVRSVWFSGYIVIVYPIASQPTAPS